MDEETDRSAPAHGPGTRAPRAHAGRLWRSGPVWMVSERRLARWVGRPVAAFLRVEAAGGIVLVAATVIALIWANSPAAESYETFWGTEAGLRIGDFVLVEDLRHWVNDALMALFFFVVGLEIKHELVAGELRDPRRAAVPAIAALGGMVVPAALYAAFNAGGPGADGWGIPMATDIAFALGVLALLGRRVPVAARVFLLTLAIIDDIGAITVIAVFYTADLATGWLLAAAAGVLAILLLRRARIWSLPVYISVGAFVWLATYLSGVHATIAGVALGLLTPARPLLDQTAARQYARESVPDQLTAAELHRLQFLLAEGVPVGERIDRALHPWSSYVVLPLFALANAGIPLGGGVLGDALRSPVTAGVVVGLVAGKLLGILSFTWLATRLRIGTLPHGVGWMTLSGLATVAGIGFTVSLFITGLAFDPVGELAAAAKVGVLAASVLAALLGAALLVRGARHTAPGPPPGPSLAGGQDADLTGTAKGPSADDR